MSKNLIPEDTKNLQSFSLLPNKLIFEYFLDLFIVAITSKRWGTTFIILHQDHINLQMAIVGSFVADSCTTVVNQALRLRTSILIKLGMIIYFVLHFRRAL